MNDLDYRRLAVAGIAVAGVLMDTTEPADRSVPEQELVDIVYELFDAVRHGDGDAADLLGEAVPSWVGLGR